MWEHSSAGRASALQAEGHRFEPCCSHHYICGCSSSGRAPPCQGGGSGFEPRHPLQSKALVTQVLFYFTIFLYCQGARRRPLRKCSGGAFLGRALMRVKVTHRKQLARKKPLHQTIPVIRSIKSVQLMY